ncbi:MAG: NfeD family protein [Comamonadaceae bacterium]|nr:MAG: NfeD family protein [Comamonadaceae bacterium]
MAESTIWWVLAGLAIALELATGTFYLLMLALGLAAAALSAHLGLAMTGQILTAAFIGSGAVVIWHLIRSRRPAGVSAGANRNLHIDIGEPVQVEHWNPDGTATVKYRGANWQAVLSEPAAGGDTSGLFRIKELLGNRLVIEKL